ncbi:MAG TPA: TIGR04283 family arsenosugar biosynthesis glycosyltransferase [Desulfomonilia bacterium]
MKRNLLIIFSRCPVPGKVKTRLIPLLGPDGAARLQRDMAAWLIKRLEPLLPDVNVRVYTDACGSCGIQSIFSPDLQVRIQVPGDIGRKMSAAFSEAFDEGFERVVLIGSDCPFITPDNIRHSFLKLEACDCVLGPAYDGGYYLIGLKRLCPDIFKDISWGGDTVLEQSLMKAHAHGMSTALLERLHDIDRPQDVELWKNLLRQSEPGISVIIPALNEGEKIVKTLRRLESGRNIEVIVVDGGSIDKTVELARLNGAEVISSASGRADQMNTGASFAAGEYLLFLHADTILPQGFDNDMRYTLADPRIIAGAFRPGFDSKGLSMRIIEYGAFLRSRYLSLPYGDQGLFIRKEDFREAQGFPELPIMEDAVFVTGLKKKGKVVTLDKKAVTSARRFEKLGAFRTWLINQCVIVVFLSGAKPGLIAELYRRHAGPAEWLGLLFRILFLKGFRIEAN